MSVIQEKNTKERILQAAFSFYTEPRFTNVPLSGIAVRAGITKAAIFRHFKSKDELFDSMRSRYFDDMRAVVPESAVPYSSLLGQIVRLIQEHEAYLFYTLYQYVSDSCFEAVVFLELEKRGVDLQSYGICSGVSEDKTHIVIRNLEKYYRLLYEIATTVFFLSGRKRRSCTSNICPDSGFAASLDAVFEHGISSSTHWLSEKRKSELDLQCIITPEDMPQVNPFFDALSAVIDKKGFPGTTIESIADELGLAKSSLYTYFKNKDELIVTLVEKELLYLAGVVIRKSDSIDSVDERGYVTMRTMLNYYLLRPSIVSITAWLRMRGSFMFDSMLDKMKIDVAELAKPKETVTGFPLSRQQFYGWLHILVTTIFCQSRINGLSIDDCMNTIGTYYRYIQQGVYNDEKI
jgi:AcrR family transcriptional regulator